jgi:hypothetical protein
MYDFGGVCMKTLRLRIDERVIDKVLYFLKKLPKDEVEVLEEAENTPSLSHESSKTINFKATTLHTKGFKFDREESHAG